MSLLILHQHRLTGFGDWDLQFKSSAVTEAPSTPPSLVMNTFQEFLAIMRLEWKTPTASTSDGNYSFTRQFDGSTTLQLDGRVQHLSQLRAADSYIHRQLDAQIASGRWYLIDSDGNHVHLRCYLHNHVYDFEMFTS